MAFYVKGTRSDDSIVWIGERIMWVEQKHLRRPMRSSEAHRVQHEIYLRNRNLDPIDRVFPTVTQES